MISKAERQRVADKWYEVHAISDGISLIRENAAAEAMDTPVTAAKTELPLIVAMARRPGNRRKVRSQMRYRSAAAPDREMMSPISTNSGMTAKSSLRTAS